MHKTQFSDSDCLCPGDGGAPLVCQQSQGSWYQAGIVSFGIGCAEKDVPAVYADVAYAACWIDQEVGCYIFHRHHSLIN